MTEQRSGDSGGSPNWVPVVVLWTVVLIPLLWGVYQTLTSVVALFAG